MISGGNSVAGRLIGRLSTAVGLLAMALLLAIMPANDGRAAGLEFGLSGRCPPGFALEGDESSAGGFCRLRSLYQMYTSLEGKGVGGLKTGLPPLRDGFPPEIIDLGRYLFFDPVLSKDGSIACASCHKPELGFADGRARSLGINDSEVPRSAPGLWNVGFLQRLFWDGRAVTLEEQMQGPLYSEIEMGNTEENLLRSLNSIAAYRALFAEAYGRAEGEITAGEVYRALAAFEATLVSLNSRYDRYAHGAAAALNAREIEGLNVFRSFVARCAECHTPPLFTNQQIAVIGTPEPAGMPFDAGAEGPSNDPSQRGGFRVPSLRNIARTAPYMHSGRFANLRDAVEFYTKGRGHAVPKGEKLNLHWHIWEPKLSDEELDRLVDFLGALTDETFMPKPPTSLPSGLKPIE